MPHKADVAALVDECTDVARRLDAVNCVVNRDGVLLGANTDGEGFVASLARGAGFAPGGQAVPGGRRRRGGPGGGAGPGRRRRRRGRGPQPDPRTGRHGRRPGRPAGSVVPAGGGCAGRGRRGGDLVVNATPVGMAGASGPEGADPRLAGGAAAAPRRPGRRRPGLRPAADAVAGRGGGRGRPQPSTASGMLVHQAAAQLVLWTGEEAPVEAMWQAAEAADPPGVPRPESRERSGRGRGRRFDLGRPERRPWPAPPASPRAAPGSVRRAATGRSAASPAG